MDKLQRFEAHNIFSAQEIILYYFVAKSRDKSMKIGEDLWQRMCDVAHKWGVTSLLTDMELVESAQVCVPLPFPCFSSLPFVYLPPFSYVSSPFSVPSPFLFSSFPFYFFSNLQAANEGKQ
jgi:hypothetical protein